MLARTLWSWADRYGLDGIVDVGAGRGELLRHLYATDPGRPLVGLDVVVRPADLRAEVGWVESPGGPELPADWRVPAEEMYRVGAIECSVPLEQLMPEAMKIATQIASKSPLAMRYAKQSMNTTMHMPPRDGYRFEQNMTVALSKSDDAAEARAAFFEKRKPEFKGR